MRNYVVFVGLFSLLLFNACRKELEITNDPAARLAFSTDTLLFDTVFTTVGSTTKRIILYNHNKNAIRISSIDLVDETPFAKYRLNVDGSSGNHQSNIEIPGNDSIFMFVEVTIKADNQQLPFLVNDAIVFNTNGNTQKVEVVSYGQNAHFYTDSVLTGHVIWPNDLPYVIYGGILVDTLGSLTIDPGVRIYLHKDAQIFVKGTLKVNGTLQDSVTFQGDRLEEEYYNEPGQWNSIQFLPGSLNNEINYATIKGAVFGVITGTFPFYGIQPELEIRNSIIKYMTITGLFGIGGKINAYNNLIFACGQFNVFSQAGGDYEFIHNTLGATNNFSGRQTASVTFTDYLKITELTFATAPLNVNFQNNIAWGYLKDEFLFDVKSSNTATLAFEYNLVRSTKTGFSATNILNKDPLFKNPSTTLGELYTEDYHLNLNSPAYGKGIYTSTPAILQKDHDGRDRQNPPTIGCFEAF